MTAISGVEFLIWLLISASTIAVADEVSANSIYGGSFCGGLVLSFLHLSFLSPLEPSQRPNLLNTRCNSDSVSPCLGVRG